MPHMHTQSMARLGRYKEGFVKVALETSFCYGGILVLN